MVALGSEASGFECDVRPFSEFRIPGLWRCVLS